MGNASILFHCNALIKYIVVIYVYPDFFIFLTKEKIYLVQHFQS